MLNLGAIEVDKTIYIPFQTMGANGESITATGLITSDVKIYKDGSETQRTGVSGIALLDDGMDFDAITGIHAFSIDLSDNDDAGFYAEGSEYWVVVDSITVNAQTVSFIAAVFNIQNRNSMLDELLKGNAHKTKFSVGAFIKKAGTGGGTATTENTVHSGTAQAGSTNTITFDTSALAVDNIYRGSLVNITGGTGVGQTASILAYVGSTKVATMAKDWITTPDNTSTFDVIASSSALNSDEGVAQAGANSTITLASTASSNNDIYNNALVAIVSGTGIGQAEVITDYNGTSKVASIAAETWLVNPDSTSGYIVVPDSEVSGDTNVNTTQITNIVNEGSSMSTAKTWAAAVVLHNTAAYGGTDAILAADQQYDYTSDVDLETSGHNGAQVLIEAKRTVTAAIDTQHPTGLLVDVFASLDGSIYDTVPLTRHTLQSKSDVEQFSFRVMDVAHFRLGIKTTDTNGTFDYQITHQRFI